MNKWLLVVLLSLTGFNIQAETLSGQVLRVADGNTLQITGPNRSTWQVNLAGITVPGLNEPWGDAARRNLSRLVSGRHVVVDFDRQASRPGRLVGRLMHGGADMNLRQLQSGLARYDRKQADLLPRGVRQQYEQAEQKARVRRMGMWQPERRQNRPWRY